MKYKYFFHFANGYTLNFESRYHIAMLPVIPVNGANLVNFEDVPAMINVDHIRLVKINGKHYGIKARN